MGFNSAFKGLKGNTKKVLSFVVPHHNGTFDIHRTVHRDIFL